MNFELMKEAFKFKLYDNKTDTFILNYLNENGYQREYDKSDRVSLMTKSTLSELWLDPFYY